ncbi:MAG: peptidoglycan recognition family protein, partial [Balneolaceae bacterium]
MKLLIILLSFISGSFLFLSTNEVEKPDIISKEEWGGKALTGEIEKHEITHITIHHAGVEFLEDKNPYEYMRNLQTFSQIDKKWIDIPYHFTIDLEGKIFENRPLEYPGDTNTEYDPTGHALINVVGNYEIQKIKPVQIDAIVHLSAWIASEYEIPVDSIASHKDYSAQTVCPGKDLYKYFEDGTIKR